MPEGRRPRSLAAGVLDRALSGRQRVDRLLERVEASLEPRDRGLVHELVLGSLRWLRRLDDVIGAASSRDLGSIDAALLSPLRIAVYQLLFLDRIPDHAAVDEAVREARRRTHKGGAGFVNAVLRRVARTPALNDWPIEETDLVRRLGIETSHPDWLVRRWLQFFGESETRDLLAANNRLKPRQVLTFGGAEGRERAAEELRSAGVESRPSSLAPNGLVILTGDVLSTELFRSGGLYLQDGASQAAALVPPPVGGERVLDLAAAPGGKSFSLLSWEDDLQIFAVDSSCSRMDVLRANRDRLGLPVRLVAADARQLPMQGRFDRVILDAPCTGTGTLRKNPELKWRVLPAEIERLGTQGLAMLEVASRRVRPGGLLCLLTCSIEREENSEVARRFLDRHPAFDLLPLEGALPPSMARWVKSPGCWQVMPRGSHDGFTVHVFRRRP